MSIEFLIGEFSLSEEELEEIKREMHRDPEYSQMFEGNYAKNYEAMLEKHARQYISRKT